MDYVLLPKRMRGRVLDMNLCREGEGMSDHFLVEARLKVVCRWRGAEMREGVRNVFKVSELNKSVKDHAYQESLRGKYEILTCRDVESVSTEWEMFSDVVKECTNDEWGVRRVDGQRKRE